MDSESSKRKARDDAKKAVLLPALVKESTDHAPSASEHVILYAPKENVFDVVDYEVGFSFKRIDFSLRTKISFSHSYGRSVWL